MSKISDERLAELVSNFERRATAEWLAEHPQHKQECEDFGAALRELQQLRAVNATLGRQCELDKNVTGQAQEEWCRTGRWPHVSSGR